MADSEPLAKTYLAALGITLAQAPEATGLEARLQDALREAKEAWPTLDISSTRFLTQLARAATAEAPLPERFYPVDVYLACACAEGLEGAIECFDKVHLDGLQRAVAKVAPSHKDDVVQALRERLLLPRADKPPMIADFAGRGSMKSWLRLAATHAGLKAASAAKKEMPTDDELIQRIPERENDPELDYVKRAYRPHFNQAFREAIKALPARQRRLLAQHFIDGVEVNRIAALHGVHRTTASRWLSEARAGLLEGLRKNLSVALKIAPAECDSLLRMVNSQLDVSIRSCFVTRD